MNKNKVLIDFFTTICVILLAVISSVGIILIHVSKRSFKNDIIDQIISSTNASVSMMETRLKIADNIASQINFNEDIIRLIDVDMENITKSADNIFIVNKCFNTLEDMKGTIDDIKTINIYNSNQDYIISSDRSLAAGDYSESMNRWIEEADKKPGSLIYITYTDEQERGIIAYIKPTSQYSGMFEGFVAVEIYTNAAQKSINDSRGQKLFSITDGERILFGDAEYGELMKSVLAKAGQKLGRQGIIEEKWQNTKYIFCYTVSSYNNWIYINGMRLDDLTRINSTTIFVMVALIFVFAVIGIFLSLIAARQLYKPLGKIMTKIRRDSELNLDANEWEYIERKLEFYRSQEEEYKKIKSAYEDREKINELKYLIFDDTVAVDKYEEIFTNSFQRIFVISVRERSGKGESGIKYAGIILRILLSMKSEGIVCEAVEHSGHVIGIANYNSEQAVEYFLNRAAEKMKAVVNIRIVIGVSDRVEMGNLSIGYSQAESAINYSFFDSKSSVFYHRDITKKKNEIISDAPVFNNLKLHDKEKTGAALKEYLDRVVYIAGHDYFEVRKQLLLFVMKVKMFAEENNIDDDSVFGCDDIYSAVFDITCYDEVERYLSDVLFNMIDYACIIDESEEYNEKILKYIEENYFRDFDVYSMANDLNISYSQLRRIFIDMTGENIISYINRYRIERAKAMLKDTRLTIQEIAVKVGYNNDQSLNRYFKKFEGVTPGEYRKRL